MILIDLFFNYLLYLWIDIYLWNIPSTTNVFATSYFYVSYNPWYVQFKTYVDYLLGKDACSIWHKLTIRIPKQNKDELKLMFSIYEIIGLYTQIIVLNKTTLMFEMDRIISIRNAHMIKLFLKIIKHQCFCCDCLATFPASLNGHPIIFLHYNIRRCRCCHVQDKIFMALQKIQIRLLEKVANINKKA